MSQENIPSKSEKEQLEEEFSRVSAELDEVISLKSKIEGKMREMDYSSSSREEINSIDREYSEMRQRFIQLTERQVEISRRRVEIK